MIPLILALTMLSGPSMPMYGNLCECPADTVDEQGVWQRDQYDYQRAICEPPCITYIGYYQGKPIPFTKGLSDWIVGYLVPKPITPARRWYATTEGDTITVHWRCLWDFDDDGDIMLDDFMEFGREYGWRWRLSDLVRFGSIYAGASDREWRYAK